LNAQPTDAANETKAWLELRPETRFDLEKLAAELHLERGSGEFEEFAALLRLAQPAVQAKVFLRRDEVEEVDANGASFGGRRFEGKMLPARLKPGGVVYPYVVSCGKELDALPFDREDPLVSFWLESLKAAALERAFAEAEAQAKALSGAPFANWMEPTDNEAWSIKGLEALFALFRGLAEVNLSEYLFMTPNKSRAGILFGASQKLLNCEFCAMRDRCEARCES
jgi:hypothetical protein